MIRFLCFISGTLYGIALTLAYNFSNSSIPPTSTDFWVVIGFGVVGAIFGILSLLAKD